jgi:hypothetical protein
MGAGVESCRQGPGRLRRLLLPPVPAVLAMSHRLAVIEAIVIPLMGAPAGRLPVNTGRAPRRLILPQSAADGHRPREHQRPRIRRIKLSAMPTNPTERSEGPRRGGLPALLMPFPFLSHVPRPRPWPRTGTARVSGETLCTSINRTVRYRPRSGVRAVGFSLAMATDRRTAVSTTVTPPYGVGLSARYERVTVRLFPYCCAPCIDTVQQLSPQALSQPPLRRRDDRISMWITPVAVLVPNPCIRCHRLLLQP